MNSALPLIMALSLGGLAGCRARPEPAPAVDVGRLDAGWVGLLARSPERFSGLMDGGGREGWAALHRGDYAGAAAAFGQGLPAARARMQEAALYEDLARLGALTWERTYATWEKKSGIPSGSAIPVVAAISALDAGNRASGLAWLAKAGAPRDPDVASALGGLHEGLHPLAGQGALSRRVNAHLEARERGDAEAVAALGASPLLEEPTETGRRILHDPLVFRTLARVARDRVDAALGGRPLAEALGAPGEPPLEALLFSPWWEAADLRADLALDPALASPGAAAPAWLTLPAPSADSSDEARARVAGLDERLEAWQSAALEQATPDGRELLEGLELVAAWRSQLLLGWARAALRRDQPHVALTYARLAQDLRRPREIGPTNPPGLYAVLAEAELRAGHAREALDALTPLVDREPLALGLSETLGDLAVLDGMDRLGDSKEN